MLFLAGASIDFICILSIGVKVAWKVDLCRKHPWNELSYLAFDMTPHISFHCKLVPVQYREYKYGLLLCTETNTCTNTLSLWNCVLLYIWRPRGHSNIKSQCKQNRTSVEASYSDSWVLENTYPANPVHWIFLRLFGDKLYYFPQSFPSYHSVRWPS